MSIGACNCEDPTGAKGGSAKGDGGETGNPFPDGGSPFVDGGLVNSDGGALACLGITGLTLDPQSVTITLDGTAPAPITFTATGEGGSGSGAVDPNALGWTATREDDTPPGEITDGIYTPNPTAGGTVTIWATDSCVVATATVTILVDAQLGTPVDAADWLPTPVEDGDVPALIYPTHETRYPRNIFNVLFQWDGKGYDEYRMVFTGPAGTLEVYTDGVHTQCDGANEAGCWEADEAAWGFIAGSNPGDEVEWVVDGLDKSTDPPTVRRSASSTIGISQRDVRGAIFYWSTTSKGIRRANIRDAEPEDYMTGEPGTEYPPDDQVKCVACHTVSRDGQYLAAPTDAESGKGLWIMDVTATAPPTKSTTDIENTGGHLFATFSPDNAHVVVSKKKEGMWMVDRATGAFEEDLPVGELKGTQPDWSPDDTRLVFATGEGDAPGGASLAMIERNADSWGATDVFLEPEGDRTLVYPMFSPEGDWVAYSEGKGGHGDDEMLLFMVNPDTGDNMELSRANKEVNHEMTDGLHQNAGPTWAPPGDLHWVAFNSKREYGVVLGGGTQQIWVAAVDLALAEQGLDPSYPAFRLPFQGLEENNHRAFWALDIRYDPPANANDGGVPPDAGPPGDAGPLPDAGPVPDAGPEICALTGEMCDPGGAGCCDSFDFCETLDDGENYSCIPIGG
jgi:hypothetical protein